MYENIHFTNCQHPKLLRNRYTGQWIYTPCGVCDVCRNRKAAVMSERLQIELDKHKYNFFVTLTYDPEFLPTAHFHRYSDCVAVLGVNRLKYNAENTYESYYEDWSNVSVPIEDVSDNELEWIDRTSNERHGIVCRWDVITFIKRLNIYYRRKYGICENAFRYCVAAEYGPSTFRPHYHASFSTDKAEVAKTLYQAICETWKNGFVDFSTINGKKQAVGYITKYLNSFSSYPKIFGTKLARPFLLYSRRPSIGFIEPGSKTHKALVTTLLSYRNSGHDRNLLDFVKSLPLYVKTSLFPKCRKFNSQSLSDLHRTYATCNADHFDIKVLSIGHTIESWTVYRSDDMFRMILDKEDKENFCPWLYNDMQVSKRVNKLARLIGVPLADYVDAIKLLYDACEYNQLADEYRQRELYARTHPDELKHTCTLDAELIARLSAALSNPQCPVAEFEFLGDCFRSYGLDILRADLDESSNKVTYSFDLSALDDISFSYMTSELNYIATNKKYAHDNDKTKKLNDAMNVLDPRFNMKDYLLQKAKSKKHRLGEMYHFN